MQTPEFDRDWLNLVNIAIVKIGIIVIFLTGAITIVCFLGTIS